MDAPCRRQFNARSLQVLAYQGAERGAVQTPSRGRCTKSRLPGHQLWASWCPGLEGLCQAPSSVRAKKGGKALARKRPG